MILRHASSCPIFPVNSAKVTHLAEHVYFKSTAYLAVWTLTFSFHLSWPLPGQSSGMLVPWILSAVDVGPGGCFQARSILNAFAKTRGAPWLSESGWDTAHSISCWPMATRAGQPGLQPASTWLFLQTPARSMEPGSGQQDLPGRSANGISSAEGGAVLVTPSSLLGNGFPSTVHTPLLSYTYVTEYPGLATPYTVLNPHSYSDTSYSSPSSIR